MDAPKRIWTDWRAANDASVAFDHPPENDGEGYRTKYILAAEHERIMAEKDAEIARLHDKLFVAWTVIETLRARLETARNDALDAAEIRALKESPDA